MDEREPGDRAHAVAELRRRIDGIPVAMVTTIDANGVLHARPMLVERIDDDATIVFLTHLSSDKASEIARDARINASFVSDRGDCYVSVGGTASVVHDASRFRALWNPTYRAWFPGGPADPDSAILDLHIERVDYWDVSASRMVRLWGVVKALATGEVAESGDHETINVAAAASSKSDE